MKLQVLSGLNLEAGDCHPARTGADVVVLAGDIGRGARGLRWAEKAFDKPVVYVPGHCEFHDFDLGVIEELKREAAACGIHVLDRDEVRIGRVRFLGCTLWTDFDLFGAERRQAAMQRAEQWVDDFQWMSDYGAPFTAQRARDLHERDRAWLHERLRDDDGAAATVVVTHHAPCCATLAPLHRQDLIGAAFVSDLDELLGHCELWVHGSGRGRNDLTVAGTRIVCNVRGSPADEDLFAVGLPFTSDWTVDLADVRMDRERRSVATP